MEIKSAANFLSNLLRLRNRLEDVQLDQFRGSLEDLLRHHYQQHWFPEKPNKGSGYRCLRINHKMDPIIAKAGWACGMDEASLRLMFPNELTLWVDPKEVSYRIGENGSICVLFDGSKTSSSTERATNNHNNIVKSPQAVVPHHHHHHNNRPSSYDLKRSSCKDSFRGNGVNWDSFIMDPRNAHFEQMTAYVSS